MKTRHELGGNETDMFPSVGSGGHVLHGGYGMSSHTHGLALDWLVGMKVVLANGTVVTVSDTQHPELYWALKGAGSSMAIVAEFYFRTFEPPKVLTTFMSRLSWNNETSAKAGLMAVQDWVADEMPLEANARLFITKQGINLEGLYYGDKDAMQSALDPLMKKLNAKIMMATPGDWIAQLTYYGMGVTLDQTHPYEKVSLSPVILSKEGPGDR
jgi:FAD/FMN-containing dehydrogenase